MSLSNPNKPVTEQRLQEFYHKIKPYMGNSGGGGASAMSDLTDVELTEIDDGQILKYDAEEEKFVNANEKSYTAGDGIVIENDEISTDNMTSEDMDEIVTPLPSVSARYHKYSTEEQIVGERIDGKPVYQRTLQLRPTKNYPGNGYIADTIYTDSNVDYMISMIGTIQYTYGNYTQRPLPYTLRTDSSHQYSAVPRWDSGNLIMEMYIEGSSYAPSDLLFTITLQYTKTTD